jgi:hypothetical protein
MRLALPRDGRPERAQIIDSETIWKQPRVPQRGAGRRRRVKLKQLNLPEEILWERIGMSPQEIERAKTLQMVDRRSPPRRAPCRPLTADAAADAAGRA